MKKTLLSVFALMSLASCQKDVDMEVVKKDVNTSITNEVVKGNETFITPDQAIKIAKKFVISEGFFGPSTKSTAVDFKMVYTDLGSGPVTKSSSKNPAYYIYNLNQEGYVIVAAHRAAKPILGFSMNGAFDSKKIPEGLVSILDAFSKDINKARELGVKPDAKTEVARAEMLSSEPLTKRDWSSIAPILGDIQWNQSPYYNADCPPNTPVGCVATAAAQIMRYWKYPKESTGTHSYYGGRRYGRLSFDYNRSWDWDKMPAQPLRSPNSEMAAFNYAVAVSVDMSFSPGGSGAYTYNVPDAMIKYFKYPKTIEYVTRRGYSYKQWSELIYKELKAGRPIEYSGYGNGGGHAFVCDGYHSKGYFHFNWGWAGSSDGYFLLDALNPGSLGVGGGSGGFNRGQGAVIGFAPPAGWDNGGDDNGDVTPNYCSSRGETSKYTYISKVRFGYKKITSRASSTGYTDNTKNPFVVSKGTTIPVEFQPGFYYYKYKMYWRVWMDLNNDGKFTDKEVIYSFSGTKGDTSRLHFGEKFSKGKYRVRVSAKYESYPTSCESFDFGEVEDFTLEIK